MSTRPSLASRLLIALVMLSRIKYRQFDPARFSGPQAKPRKTDAFLPPARLSGVTAEQHDRHGWPSFDVRPSVSKSDAGSGPAPSVLYLHGGAHAAEIQGVHWRYVAALAARSGRTVTVPIYPLAPEHTYRDVEPGLVEIYRELTEAADGTPPVVMGDSAGGNLALGVAQAVPADLPAPELVIMLSASGDATLSHPAITETAKSDPLLHPPHLIELFRLYADDLPLDDPRISPINGPMDRLRRVAIFIGTREVLVHDAERLADRLAEAGVDVVLENYDGMPHDWMLMPIPEAKRQLDQTIELLDNVRRGQGAQTA